MKPAYDCIVIGAGPAGCTVATLVAMQGFSTLLLEREKMPRFHIGESLMPETFWPLQRMGLVEKMKSSSFVKKLSVQFVSHTGKESQPFFFPQHDPRECSQTWQVERAKFDQMLFQNAAEKGAECRDQSRVLDVLFETDGTTEIQTTANSAGATSAGTGKATGVRVQSVDGVTRDIGARVVVDATGLQAMLANRMSLKVDIPELRKAAIWGYYRNARRDQGDNAGATLILHTSDKNAWFWFIPLENNVTSIGVVADREYLLKGRGTPAEIFEDELVRCPALVERLIQAELVSDFRIAKEFSYTTRQHAGNGWVLVGDAFGFIDPIYSSGVYLAFRSGELAADAIVAGFRSNNLTAEQLGAWTTDFKNGVTWIRKLVMAFYTNPFSFGDFMRNHPQHKGNLVDILIGRVFHDDAGRIFDDMDPMLERLQKMTTTTHLPEKCSSPS